MFNTRWLTMFVASFAMSFLLIQPTTNRAGAADPIVPQRVIRPLDGNGLSGLTTWLKSTGRKDPQNVFTVKDGVLHASGGDMGYVATADAYKNYHLSVEYKWGKRPPKAKYVRNSGVLLHAVGPDGSRGGVWMTSIECQLAQGCEGDLIVIRGKDDGGETFPATITSDTKLPSAAATASSTKPAALGATTPFPWNGSFAAIGGVISSSPTECGFPTSFPPATIV